jgi:predicted dehydrogenase
MKRRHEGVSRRSFLQSTGSAAAGAAFAATLAIPRMVHAGVDASLRIGLVGCGSRGTSAAQNALNADPNNILVAVGDTFADQASSSVRRLRRIEALKDRVQVADDHVFTGFDAYKQVVDSDVDVVIHAEPPHFRPAHLAYSIAAGKHVFVEKPVAVDAPGVRSVGESCRQAEKNRLAVFSGLCWRYDPAVQETVRRVVEDGAIGDIVAIRSCYNSSGLWHRGDKPEWSRMEYQIRNWLYFNWLSGDCICEQAVHSLDKTAWVQGDPHPLRAFGTGGRQQRTDAAYGNIFDHHSVFYEYPNGIEVAFMCRQQNDCSAYVDEVVLGTKGQAHLLEKKIEGENPWRYEGPESDMYDLEHVALFESIRAGKPINNGDYMCNSTLIGIMGRMCTYTGQTLTWDECIKSEERLGPSEYGWTNDVPKVQVAIPGRTRLVTS